MLIMWKTSNFFSFPRGSQEQNSQFGKIHHKAELFKSTSLHILNNRKLWKRCLFCIEITAFVRDVWQ